MLPNYKWNLPKKLLYPFAKFQYYDGKKFEKMLELYGEIMN
jgi:hypothetical protein